MPFVAVEQRRSSKRLQDAVDKYRQEHAIRAPMTKAWGKAKGQQNKGGSHASAAQAKVTSTPQAKAGYLFDAVWWIKE